MNSMGIAMHTGMGALVTLILLLTREPADRQTRRIPMVGAADSLNLAVAGSLLLYEVYRARSARRGRSP
jgi:hypothetical protein